MSTENDLVKYTPANVQIFYVSTDDILTAGPGDWRNDALIEALDEGEEASEEEKREAAAGLSGFYWWTCSPGCMPDSDASGPFETEDEANEDAGGGEFEEKVLALAKMADCEPNDISEERHDHYGLTVYNANGCEYAVGTDEEADTACQQYVESSIWAFNASFILSQCELPHQLEEAIQAWQEKECEGANDGLLAMVEKLCGLPDFTSAAVSADGRGHFLSPYDGDELEEGEFYAYRVN